MLLSHSHKFIFVKTRKSAGTSCEISLARYCDGPKDVVTKVLRSERRFQDMAGVRSKNILVGETGPGFQGHMPAAAIIKMVGWELWDEYTTFCVVRNPWSRAVSQFFFRLKHRQTTASTFEEFICKKEFTVELPMYRYRGLMLVDRVLRFERLDEDLRSLAEALGLEWDGWLPVTLSGFRPKNQHYSEYYTSETREIVAARCAKEIALHDYRFSPTDDEIATPPPSRPDMPIYLPPLVTWHQSSNLLAGNECKPVLKSDFELAENSQAPLRSLSTGVAIEVNDSAHALLSLCDGNRSAADIFECLKDRYQSTIPDGELSAETLISLDELRRREIIEAPDLTGYESAARVAVDFRDIPFLVINCEDALDRRKFMTGQLEDLGLEYRFVPGIRARSMDLGIARAHLNAIASADIEKPFVILEDDCEFTEEFDYKVQIPADADAYYLGTSYWGNAQSGALSPARFKGVRMMAIDDKTLRVFNMLTRHAILYCSTEFANAAVDAVSAGFEANDAYPGHAYYAMLQASYKVFAPKIPMCKQRKELGGIEGATAKPLADLLTIG